MLLSDGLLVVHLSVNVAVIQEVHVRLLHLQHTHTHTHTHETQFDAESKCTYTTALECQIVINLICLSNISGMPFGGKIQTFSCSI